MSIGELDRVFCDAPLLPLPHGRFDGIHLVRLRNRGADLQPIRFLDAVVFQRLPWGIDFDANVWFSFSPVLTAGRFEARAERSRWRDTRAFGMHYGVSRLPELVKRALYDEVKPLGGALCLGIGGINREAGMGDHFYFALARRA